MTPEAHYLAVMGVAFVAALAFFFGIVRSNGGYFIISVLGCFAAVVIAVVAFNRYDEAMKKEPMLPPEPIYLITYQHQELPRPGYGAVIVTPHNRFEMVQWTGPLEKWVDKAAENGYSLVNVLPMHGYIEGVGKDGPQESE